MKNILMLVCFLIGFNSCSEKCNKPQVKEDNSEALDSLILKLDATEAQLYNARMELSKCKGDSIPL